MLLELSRSSGIELHVQLHNQIKMLILSGRWKDGRRLPTERELAKRLTISRTTVTRAYKALEEEGYITSQRGRGTFVSHQAPAEVGQKFVYSMTEMADEVLDQIESLNLPPDQFIATLQLRLKERLRRKLDQINLCFIECNHEQLEYNVGQLASELNLPVAPILIQDLRRADPAKIRLIRQADIVLTTDFHQEEICSLLEDKRILIDVVLVPEIKTIVKISRFPRSTEVALVCNSKIVDKWVRESIAAAGLKDLSIISTYSPDNNEIAEFLKGKKYVIITPLCYHEILPLCDPGAIVVEYIYRPDEGSVRFLKRVIREVRERKNQAIQAGQSQGRLLETE